MILDRAAELLAASPNGDISTRAVSEAADITQPILYRHFGDKEGLLSAVVDRVWEQYLESKRAARPSSDPLTDLRAGWDNHTTFALENPHAYRLVFGTALAVRPSAIAEAMRLLTEITRRLAAAGRLAVGPDEAAQAVMAANSGYALGAILRPEIHAPDASHAVRETTFRGVLADPAETDAADPVRAAVATVRERLVDVDFTNAEATLFTEWLGRI